MRRKDGVAIVVGFILVGISGNEWPVAEEHQRRKKRGTGAGTKARRLLKNTTSVSNQLSLFEDLLRFIK